MGVMTLRKAPEQKPDGVPGLSARSESDLIRHGHSDRWARVFPGPICDQRSRSTSFGWVEAAAIRGRRTAQTPATTHTLPQGEPYLELGTVLRERSGT